MKNSFSPKQIETAKAAKSVKELLVLSKESGIELTEAEAVNLFAQLNPTNGELADSELEQVAGGCGDDSSDDKCPKGGNHIWSDTGHKEGHSSHSRLIEQKCTKCNSKRLIARRHA